MALAEFKHKKRAALAFSVVQAARRVAHEGFARQEMRCQRGFGAFAEHLLN
jgi:hypothetical protein